VGWLSEILVGIGGGVATAAVLTVATRALRLSQTRRDAAWFGSGPGDDWLALLPRHYREQRSVSFNVVAALGEIVRLADSVGCTVTALPSDEVNELGELTELAIGGAGDPGTRTATHLRTWVPSFTVEPWEDGKASSLAFRIDGDEYPYQHGVSEYALLVRFTPGPEKKPIFVIAGQGSRSEHAAARYLRQRYRSLRRRFGSEPFALLLHNRESAVYGASLIDEVREAGVTTR
jgi:hypothetical protein